MSFIDLTKTDIWSEEDIVNRTESMIAAEFPKTRVDILSRKVSGQAMGYVLTAQEQADLQTYQALCYYAGAEADAARADKMLLASVMAHEVQMARLAGEAQPEFIESAPEDGMDVALEANPLLEQDSLERACAQGLVDAAAQDVLDLYLLRNPTVAPEICPIGVLMNPQVDIALG